MALLRWLAGLVRATLWLALNLAISIALFLGSAALAASGDPEIPPFVVPFLRGLASFWLFLATWYFVLRGVLARPPAVPDRTKKPTGAEVARSTFGCVAWLIPVAVTYVYVGRLADWAWAGVGTDDTTHPVRRLADRGHALLTMVAEHPDVYVPYVVGGLVALVLLNALAGMLLGSRPVTPAEARHGAAGSTPPTGGRQRRRGRRDDVAAANEAVLERTRAVARSRERGLPASIDPGTAPGRVAAGASSAAAVGAAHVGAHARQGSLSGRTTSAASSDGVREDAVLGALTWSRSDGAWWAHRGGEGFAVRIDGAEDGPSVRQLDLARAVAQRSFEVLLRGSDAARPAAQARGVGLPRFTIAAAVVGGEAGAATPVTLHLACDGDPKTDYVVRSVDGLLTFKAR